MKKIVIAFAVVVLAACNQSPSSSASGATKSDVDKEFSNLNTGRVVNGASSGDCDAACQSRIKK